MDNRSRGFRLAAAAVMLVFLLAVSAFAMAEADPIRVSSLSEPQSVISEQDVSITIKVYNGKSSAASKSASGQPAARRRASTSRTAARGSIPAVTICRPPGPRAGPA